MVKRLLLKLNNNVKIRIGDDREKDQWKLVEKGVDIIHAYIKKKVSSSFVQYFVVLSCIDVFEVLILSVH